MSTNPEEALNGMDLNNFVDKASRWGPFNFGFFLTFMDVVDVEAC